MSVRRGRRPGSPDTRASILAAARERFAQAGFAGTSVRGVAADAGVDPALVHHYFGTKDELFLAAMQVPVDPRDVMAPVVAGGLDGAGERLLRAVLEIWDDEQTRLPMLTLVRGAVEPGGSPPAQDGLMRVVLGPVGAALGLDEPDVRMSLAFSQIVGVVMLRYVVAMEPLASLPTDQVVTMYAPTLQRYLADPLPDRGRAPS